MQYFVSSRDVLHSRFHSLWQFTDDTSVLVQSDSGPALQCFEPSHSYLHADLHLRQLTPELFAPLGFSVFSVN